MKEKEVLFDSSISSLVFELGLGIRNLGRAIAVEGRGNGGVRGDRGRDYSSGDLPVSLVKPFRPRHLRRWDAERRLGRSSPKNRSIRSPHGRAARVRAQRTAHSSAIHHGR